MAVNHRILRLVFAFGFGLLVATWSYQWISNPDRAAQRRLEESVVLESRQILRSYFPETKILHISDPLDRVRQAGKVYLFPTSEGWELSGHYQRDGESRWHPFLMSLDENASLLKLSVEDEDPGLRERAKSDAKFSVSAGRQP